jgi:hypothetical protein
MCTFDEQYIDDLQDEFKHFEDTHSCDDDFKQMVSKTDNGKSSFSDKWRCFEHKFPKLVAFCGGLSSVFPGTSTVESDFSVIGWEKNAYRFNLTDLSLEGILHTKQRNELLQIEAYIGDKMSQE